MDNSMTIEQAICEYDDVELLQYLQKIEKEANHKELFFMQKSATYDNDCTALLLALNLHKSVEVILKLIDIGGQELVMMKSAYNWTALHEACKNKNVSLEIVSKLIEMGGRELVMINYKFGGTALHFACGNENLSIGVISMLIEIGGQELVDTNNTQNNWTTLQYACKNKNVPLAAISKLIQVGGRKLVMMRDTFGGTALNDACRNKNVSLDIISKLLEIGGQELVVMSDNFGTALHNVCKNESLSLDVVSKLIGVGGQELVVMKTGRGSSTALHAVFMNSNVNGNVLLDIVSKLIEAGGQKLVMTTNSNDQTALHYACGKRNVSLDIISKLIEIGGQELVMMSNEFGTALHYACSRNAVHYPCNRNRNVSLDIVLKLIEVGGRELVMMNTGYGCTTALHAVCMDGNVSVDVVSKLIELGGRELLMISTENGDIALHYGYFVVDTPKSNGVFELLVKESILANVGGEIGIGGLFNVATHAAQQKIYEKWEEISPALKSATESLQEHQQPSILHAAIIAKAPSRVIHDIINQFEYNVLKTDRLGKYPIEVALRKRLDWKEGLQQIVEATAVALHQHPIYTCARYGLKWKHHMKELAQASGQAIMSGHDSLTGLHLFMVAAMGHNNDLSAIYGMMRMSPAETINIF